MFCRLIPQQDNPLKLIGVCQTALSKKTWPDNCNYKLKMKF